MPGRPARSMADRSIRGAAGGFLNPAQATIATIVCLYKVIAVAPRVVESFT